MPSEIVAVMVLVLGLVCHQGQGGLVGAVAATAALVHTTPGVQLARHHQCGGNDPPGDAKDDHTGGDRDRLR